MSEERSLEDKLQAAGDPVEMARNSQIGPYVYPMVASEFSNWRDEQVAWRETCALFDQSHHMTDLYDRGAGRRSSSSPTSGSTASRSSRPTRRSSSSRAIRDGYVIGDGILFYLEQNKRQPRRPAVRPQLGPVPRRDRRVRRRARSGRALGRQPAAGASSTATRSRARTRSRCSRRPPAGRCPRSSSSTWATSTIAGHNVRALRSRHVRRARLELFGPWEEGEEVKAALVEAGEEFGLAQVGSRVYATNTLESGWIPSPASSRLHRRGDEGLPAMAAGRRLRGDGLARRQLLCGRHRGLLPDARTSSATGRSSSSTTTSSGERRSRRSPRSRSARRSPWPGTAKTSPTRWERCSRRATPPSTSTCRSPTTRPGPTTR